LQDAVFQLPLDSFQLSTILAENLLHFIGESKSRDHLGKGFDPTRDCHENSGSLRVGVDGESDSFHVLSFVLVSYLLYRHFTRQNPLCKKNLLGFVSRDFDKTLGHFDLVRHGVCSCNFHAKYSAHGLRHDLS